MRYQICTGDVEDINNEVLEEGELTEERIKHLIQYQLHLFTHVHHSLVIEISKDLWLMISTTEYLDMIVARGE